jgi:hypothetical protein
MTSQEFLATVLPSSGVYCTAEISTAKREHVFVNTIDELYNAAMAFDEKGTTLSLPWHRLMIRRSALPTAL